MRIQHLRQVARHGICSLRRHESHLRCVNPGKTVSGCSICGPMTLRLVNATCRKAQVV